AQETAGEILEYDGKPILVLYHAVSGGRTEDVELVYGQSLPYLRGVESLGEELSSRYESVQVFSREAFAKAVNDAYPEAKLSASKLERQVSVQARSASGRVIGLRVGGAYIDGRDLRKVLGLNSTQFELTYNAKQVMVSQRGYGHGVGMSQAGAEAMARAGSSYADILHHYYTDVQIVHIVPENGPE
ncbi:MAG TPA: SpoIID/LytB domain-containing protein, partial [Clostridia bacterium]|nr:SpoIID/LytB domain-containing protein [Clostridia bacterium]